MLHSKKRVKAAALLFLFVVIGLRLFYKLGDGRIAVTDEAWYGVNAVEMLRSGNWLVPTLRGQVDYASKPPLGLRGILIGFVLLGTDLLGLRLYSAVAGLLTIILICFYLYKKYDIRYSIVAAAVFPALWQCFEMHMYRAGDMDALFGLFYLIAMIALSEVQRDKSWMIIVYGAAVGLGFLTKSMHVAVFIVVGVLYLPVIFRKLKVKELLLAALAAIVPVAIWMIARYRYDGLAYIKSITLGEAGDQTRGGLAFEYLRDISREKVTWILVAVLISRAVAYFVQVRTVKRAGGDLLAWFKERYLSILAYLVPIVFYTLAGHYMMWYIDPAYVAVVWIIAIETVAVVDKIGPKRLKALYAYAVMLACVFYSVIQIYQYKGLGNGGGAIEQFRNDITEFRTDTAAEYDGYNAYIAYDRSRYVGNRGHWELDYVFLGEANAYLNCLDGGVEGFLEDEDSILILDGELWDQYAAQLTGYVFLEQNTFYVLSHDRY